MVTKCATDTALAKSLGVSQPAVARWKRHPAWGFKPPYDAERVAAWRAEYIDPPPTDEVQRLKRGDLNRAKQVASVRLLVAREAKLELERQIQAGHYVKRENVEAGNLARIAAIKAGLLTLPRSLPPLLMGMDAAGMERTIEEAVYDVLSQLATGALQSGEPGNRPNGSLSVSGQRDTDTSLGDNPPTPDAGGTL